jgi:hypothetical protein
MDNLQVRGLQNQTATPNALNPGLGTSLQSQNRGLNTQQVRSITELSSSFSLLWLCNKLTINFNSKIRVTTLKK